MEREHGARPPLSPSASKRLLFVDDEPNVLNGLKRLLRSRRDAWEMVFVGSGNEALAAMESASFDVVVTDMRMPGMDGASFLAEVQARSPGTVRIVLTGHSDVHSSLRCVHVTHQCLDKPCDPDLLREVVNRACNIEHLLVSPRLRGVVGEVSNLPALPETYRALNAALAEEDVDLGAVAEIVERDLGIAAKVLQLVNSSFFGVRQEITAIKQAIAYLGADRLRDLVLSFEVFQGLEQAARGLPVEREYGHSLLAARIAKRILPAGRESDQAFLAGMLHDIGRLILATCMPREFADVAQATREIPEPLHRVERRVLGVTHAEIGAYLLALWGMPYPVVEAVAHHHDPGTVEGQSAFGVLAAVHVADALARELDGEPDDRTPQIDHALLERLGVAGRLSEWRAIARVESGIDQEAA